jgi:Zn-dependent protease with chaperone function
MKEPVYPFTPANANLSSLKPTTEYKKEIYKVISAIGLFFTVYLVLVVLAVLLAIFVSYLGIMLILMKLASITILLGIGMIGLGLMVLFYLIKFIFTIKRVDRSGFYELAKNENQYLISFLTRLSKETKTKLPKRIYISPDVNASVFYDSSFLSMFIPVKKNLVIGLGLLNSVNMSEFKAIVAHEFGHFSQQSMSLGSYVYNVNKVIYNLLYENEGYANTIESWASASGIFALFANLTVKIVQAIQWVLRKLYVVVNKANLSLSRQMEHHADSVSTYVSGSNHLYTALKRLEIGDVCYNQLLNKYDKWIPKNYKPDNAYPQHQEVLKHFSEDNNLNFSNGLPEIDSKYISTMKQSRVIIKDQWASHPSTEERNTFIKSLNIDPTETISDKPWSLFNNPEIIQSKLTEIIFSNVKYKEDVKPLDFSTFKEMYYTEFVNYTFQKEYKGFYDNRRINNLNLTELISEDHLKYKSFDELFSPKNYSLINDLEVLQSDIDLLKQIIANPKIIKTFDFDGKKYKSSDAPNLVEDLEKTMETLKEKILDLDKEIFKFFNSKTFNNKDINLVDAYNKYFVTQSNREKFLKNYNEFNSNLSSIYQREVPIVEARQIIDQVKIYEKIIVNQIRELLYESKEQKYLDEDEFKKIDWYISKDRKYLDDGGFNDTELEVLNEAMSLIFKLMAVREFQAKKNLLKLQLDILTIN